MFSLSNKTPTRANIGKVTPPERPYLVRVYNDIVNDVIEHYHRYPKRVDSDNIFGRLLTLIPRRWDLDDHRYLRYVDDASEPLSRAFNFVSSSYRGRIYESGVTMGREADEVVITHYEGIPKDLDKPLEWRYWSPIKYLNHSMYDLQLPIMNNHLRVKGSAVISIDIPLMALQYRRWLKRQKVTHEDQRESVYRYVGGYLLPNAVRSYLDIAVFNRLEHIANGKSLLRFPSAHPFYITDLSNRVDNYCKQIIADNKRKQVDLEAFVYNTPLIMEESLHSLMRRLPDQPVTHNNEWAFIAARIPYLRYLVVHGIPRDGGDRHHVNDIYESIIESSYDRVFSGVGSSRVIQGYKRELLRLKETIEDKRQGW